MICESVKSVKKETKRIRLGWPSLKMRESQTRILMNWKEIGLNDVTKRGGQKVIITSWTVTDNFKEGDRSCNAISLAKGFKEGKGKLHPLTREKR